MMAESFKADRPDEVYSQPANGWVAEFLRVGESLMGRVKHLGTAPTVHTDAGDFNLECSHNHQDGDQVQVLIRPAGASVGGEAGQESVSRYRFRCLVPSKRI